ncbi:MAG TPA: PPK2 family polyphosphate kinase [Ramlibacter sp.]|jgi:PPK2 family polyphosphate:nucleotide phosphotransferase
MPRKKQPSHTDLWTRYRFTSADAAFSLATIDPAARPFSSGRKARDRHQVDELAIELDQLQNIFYADRRYKLLIVLQGIDTSGKDGTLRAIFSRTTPLGVRTVAWKAPTETERSHDFLWRIHQQVPGAGEIVAFNRSHYEDVLVPVVDRAIDAAEARRRFAQINDFERMLAEQRTVILKFMLHISKDEQRNRLQDRIDDPDKRWKFQRGDLAVRKQWDDYRRAFERAIGATSTPWAPWIVVPADSKTHRNLMVCLALRDTMRSLDLHYPDGDPGIAALKVK